MGITMIVQKKTNLHNYFVIDKTETSIFAADCSMSASKEIVRAVKKNLEKTKSEDRWILRNTDNDSVIVYQTMLSDTGAIRLGASWNPQKWFSGQNVYPMVKKCGGLYQDPADTVEHPFKLLAATLGGEEKKSILDIIEKEGVDWSRLDCATYTRKVPSVREILQYFHGICGTRVAAKDDFMDVAEELGFEYKRYKDEETKEMCGIVFNKMSGGKTCFKVSMYRKGVEVRSRLGNEDTSGVEDRLRVEAQLYPDTFFRGQYSAFKRLFKSSGVKSSDHSYWRSSKFLRASKATVETFREMMSIMYYQLGLHLIFAAVRQSVVKDKVIGLASNPVQKEIAEKWISGELELKHIKDKQKRRVILSFYRKVEDNLRFNPSIVSFATFAFIRHSLRSSMVTKAELVELAGLEDSGDNDARILEIRRVAGERALAALTSMRQVKAIWGV